MNIFSFLLIFKYMKASILVGFAAVISTHQVGGFK